MILLKVKDNLFYDFTFCPGAKDKSSTDSLSTRLGLTPLSNFICIPNFLKSKNIPANTNNPSKTNKTYFHQLLYFPCFLRIDSV